MTDQTWLVFALSAMLGGLASLVLFLAGGAAARLAVMQSMGGRMYRTKLWALDRIWPLTLFRVAWERRRVGLGCAVLTPLILMKSAGCLVLGVIVLVWLPLAMLILPSLFSQVDAYQHPEGRRWMHRVILLQGGSHLVAAAAGAAVQVAAGFQLDRLIPTAGEHSTLLIVAVVVSAALGIGAGWAESWAHIRLNLLENEVAGIL